jgi:hypothetical protein
MLIACATGSRRGQLLRALASGEAPGVRTGGAVDGVHSTWKSNSESVISPSSTELRQSLLHAVCNKAQTTHPEREAVVIVNI